MEKTDIYSDQDLLLRIAQADETAFDQLFMDMYTPLLLLVSRLIGSEESAKDVVSDSFLQMWKSRTSLTHVKDIKAYLYTTARNGALDFIKKRQRSQQRENKALEQDWLSPSPEHVIQAILDAEALRVLHAAIQTLPTECQKIVKLGMDGYSTSEIALQLNITSSAVSHQKARAIRLLKDKISPGILLSVLVWLN